MRQEVEESKNVAIDLTNQVQAARIQNQELMGDLKMSGRKEQELREQATKLEQQVLLSIMLCYYHYMIIINIISLKRTSLD
jgi:hypothetical protein